MRHGNDKEDIKKVLEDAEQRCGGNLYCNFSWYAFPQTWGSTALGFGGIGGQAMTTAQTYVVITYGTVYVYFGSRFAYEMKGMLREKIDEYINQRRFPSIREYQQMEAKQ